MKTKTFFMVVVCAMILTGAVQAAEKLTDEQKAGLAKIEQYVEERKQIAEDRYVSRLAELSAERQFRQQSIGAGNVLKNIRGGFLGGALYLEETLRREGIDLRRDKDYTRTFRKFRDGPVSRFELFALTPKLLAIAEKRLVEQQQRQVRQVETEQVRIEKGMRYTIEVQLPQLEEKLKNNVLNPPTPAPEGMVTGIVYSQDRPAAVIGSKIVHEGQQIDKIRIASIMPDSVEFEKGGNHWTQKPGEEPSKRW